MSATDGQLNRESAVTRSLLGWGVVAGPFYIVVGLVLAVTRPGFDLTQHALSLLTLGDFGWLQRTNLIVSGLMVLAAAFGFFRAIRSGRGLAVSALVGVYGLGLILSGVFPPDPVDGFPPGSTASATVSGMLHLVFGALGFVALAAAALAYAAWARAEAIDNQSGLSIALGVVVLVGFVGGAALSQTPFGVGLLWLAVLAGWAWLAIASARVYQWTPHPVTGVRR
jgi:hypothetical membrane protein